ncbi:ABC transporter ATP-binding protein [Candidatus Uhrbacteria bacterium]|nr:ABC transporter ATP-binding protein [Candidatus Uhrbacteria bacterium]
MKEVWEAYLSGEEKTRYLKLAAGLTVVGAAEGIAPSLIGLAMDNPSAKMAAMLALGYLGTQTVTGWVQKKLSVDFDRFLHDIMQKQEGLNQRLARDLAFQPGERMAKGESRGKITATLRRSQDAFQDILYSVAKTQAPAIASTVVGLGMMLANDWRLGLVSLTSAPIAVAISRRNEKKSGPIIEEAYRNEEKIAEEVEDQLLAHQDIVLSGMREQMAGRLEGLAKKKGDLSHERRSARQGMQFQSQTLNGGVFAALTAGGVALRELGVQQSGAIVTALVYSGMFRNSWDQIVYANNSLLESLKSIEMMEEVFNGYADAEVEADDQRIGASEIEEYSFEVDHVSLGLEGEGKIIDDVSFRVPAGGVVRLEGKSGQGKTTLTRLMSGYYQPSQGEIRIGGHAVSEIKKAGPDSLYARVAYLSQHPYIFESGSIKDNLAFGNPDVTDDQMRAVLQELELAPRFTIKGVLQLDEKPQGLSGGEKARLGLARVLLKIRSHENGGVVFLDQATEELDEQTEAQVAHILLEEKRQRPNTTFVIISHREEFVEALSHPKEGEGLSIQRVRLSGGKLVEDSSVVN